MIGRAISLVTILVFGVSCGSGGALTQTGSGGIPQEEQPELVVVRMDQDDDGIPDLVTLDVSQSPSRVVEVLAGEPDG